MRSIYKKVYIKKDKTANYIKASHETNQHCVMWSPLFWKCSTWFPPVRYMMKNSPFTAVQTSLGASVRCIILYKVIHCALLHSGIHSGMKVIGQQLHLCLARNNKFAMASQAVLTTSVKRVNRWQYTPVWSKAGAVQVHYAVKKWCLVTLTHCQTTVV